MNLLAATILISLLLVVVIAPRRWALMGIMAAVLYLTQGQHLTLLGFNLYAVRFIELAGFVRVMARREFSFSKMVGLDKVLLLLYIYTTAVFVIRSNEGQAYQIGVAVDAFLCYFTFRGLVGGIEDFRWFLRAFLIILTPFVALVLVESLTKQNPFVALGGVTEYVRFVRDGRYRCFGSFRHPSLLGTLGASFLPLYIGFAAMRAERKLAVIGIGLCLLIVWASNSGGPASSAAVAAVGWLFWRLRKRMRLVRWWLVLGVAMLALVMKAPIWYLPARVSSMSGGDGWHRSHLMDMAFQDLGQWGLAGLPKIATGNWMPYTLSTGEADMTNQYLSFGIAAGLGSMVLFIALLVVAFKNLGKALATVRSDGGRPNETEFLLWGLGVMLFVHSVNFLGITYFDQTYAIWYLQLAAVAGLSEYCTRSAAAEAHSNGVLFEQGHAVPAERDVPR